MRPCVTPVVRPLFRTCKPMTGSFVPRTRPIPRISGVTSRGSIGSATAASTRFDPPLGRRWRPQPAARRRARNSRARNRATGPGSRSLNWIGTKSTSRAIVSCKRPPSAGPGCRIGSPTRPAFWFARTWLFDRMTGRPFSSREDAQRPGGDLDMADADAARRRTGPLRPFEVDRLFGSQGVEAARFDDVRTDVAERLRDDVPMTQLRLGLLRLDEDDNAALVRLAAADHLVPDRDPDHVRPGEDGTLVRSLRGADVVRWHASLLALERADLEEAFAELPARRRAGDADDHVRDEADEDPDSVIREEVPGVQEGHHADAEDDRHERSERAPLDLVPPHREQEEPTQDDPHEDEAELVDVHSVPSENGRNSADSG